MEIKDMIPLWCGASWLILGIIQKDKFLIQAGIVLMAIIGLNGMFLKLG